VKDLLNLDIAPWVPSSDITTISTEVMIVTGGNATVMAKDVHILYDTEIIAVIQRNKSKSKGLVMTYVWGWVGKNASFGDKEDKKLHELAKRYGTSLVSTAGLHSGHSDVHSLLRPSFNNTSSLRTSFSLWAIGLQFAR
jgi:hypothetical protein